MAMSEGLPGSASCSDKEDIVDQDEEHLRHHVQNWLDAALAVSGQRLICAQHVHIDAGRECGCRCLQEAPVPGL